LANLFSVNIDLELTKLVRKDSSLHKAILIYQPIWLNDFKAIVKEAGYKFTVAEIVSYLDRQVSFCYVNFVIKLIHMYQVFLNLSINYENNLKMYHSISVHHL